MKFKSFAAAMIIMIPLSLLVGCGGGGGGPSGPAPVMKGFWGGTSGTTNTSAIVLANGDSWLVFQESGIITRFARLQVLTSGTGYSGTGNQYLMQTGAKETATATGTFAEKTTISGAMSAAGVPTNLNLTYNTLYEVPAKQADAVGVWTGSFGGNSSNCTLTVVTTGVLTGSSTTACSYSGTVQPRTVDPAVFDVNFTETCVGGGVTVLSGIATVNAAKTAMSIAATAADKASGALFIGQKQQ